MTSPTRDLYNMAIGTTHRYLDDQGWFICHKDFLDNVYKNCIDYDASQCKLKFRNVFFDVRTPFLMDSAAASQAQKILKPSSIKKKNHSGKKKGQADFYHNTIRSIIEGAVQQLVNQGRNVGYLLDSTITAEEWFQNNSKARQASKEINNNRVCDSLLEQPAVFHEYMGNEPTLINIHQSKVVLPPNSTFVLGDISNIGVLKDRKYDVILIDPPWVNKSVKRKKGYFSLSCKDLLDIPIPHMTKPGSLVVLWATNNISQISFIKEQLFHHWGIQHCADWHWAKVTQRGTLIHPLDSCQKKPYENLILGRVYQETQDLHSGDISSELPAIEQHKVIVSIPSSIHSHKPPLCDVLKPYIPKEAKCLELFARYLLPGWTSCGNEVLKFQNLQLFGKTESGR